MGRNVTVYRFESESWGRKVSPRHMLGTLEAIAALGAQPLLESAREVDAAELESGFLFESFNAAAETTSLDSASRRIRMAVDPA